MIRLSAGVVCPLVKTSPPVSICAHPLTEARERGMLVFRMCRRGAIDVTDCSSLCLAPRGLCKDETRCST